MTTEVFVLCDAATEAQGKLNILGTFDTIFTPTVPSSHPHCAIALRLRFSRIEAGKHRLALSIVDVDGKPVVPPIEGEMDVKFADDAPSSTANLVMNIDSLPVQKFGENAINLALDGRQIASLPIFVRRLPGS